MGDKIGSGGENDGNGKEDSTKVVGNNGELDIVISKCRTSILVHL